MDLSGVRARRRKSLFRPWNSYLAKKNAHDTVMLAQKYDEHRRNAQEGHMPHISPLVRLTVKLIDTYEDINHAYYDHRANNAALAAAAEAEAAAAAGNVADYHQQAHYTYEQQQAPSHYHVSYPQHVHDHDPHDHYYSVENPHEHPIPEAEAPFEHYPYNQPLMQQEHYQGDYNMPAVPLQHQQLVEEPQMHPYNDPHQSYSAASQHMALDAHPHHHLQAYPQWPAPHPHVQVNPPAGPAPKKPTSPAAGVIPLTAVQAAANTEPSSSPHSIQHPHDKFDYIVSRGEIFNNRYNIEQVIGRGSFGQVVRALDTRDNTHVAIKIIKNNSSYVEHALKEVRMTSYLNSIDRDDEHSIMRLRDKFIYRGHQCLVLELLACSLYDLLCDTSFHGVTLNLVRKFCKQILSCLSFLARPDINIAHCDLKPENVLLRHPQRSTIKVVDFGAAAHISDSMLFYVQSRFYRAPEVILGVTYTTQVDVWSLGCMLIELHTGRPVFAGKDEGDQMAIIVKRLGIPPAYMLENGKKTHQFFELDTEQDPPQWRLRPPLAAECATREPSDLNSVQAFVDHYSNGRRKRASGGHSEEDYDVFLKLALKMLEYDPEKRITAAKAMKDPFVCGVSTRPGSSSGRESPPPMPNGVLPVNKTGSHASVDPGRRAPHQRITVAAATAAAAATATAATAPSATAATAVSSNGTAGSSAAGSSSANGGPVSVQSVSKMVNEINLDQGTDVKSSLTEIDSGNSATATTTAKPIATHAVVSAPKTTSTLNTTTSLSDITSQANFVSDNQATDPSSLTATALGVANDSTAVESREDVAHVTSNSDSETVSSSAIDSTAATSSRSTRRVMIDPGCSSDGGDGNRDRNGERISHEQSREGNKDDIGGRLRTSKSEPAIESLAPKRTFVFARSDWAEEVGIEPPPWRSGAPLDMDADPASPRWGAGSGTKHLKRRPRSSQKVGTNCGFGHGGTCIQFSSIRNCPARQRFPHRYDQYQSNRWNWRNRADFSPKPGFVPSYIMPDHGVGRTAILQEPQKPELLPFGHGDALRLRTDLRTGLH